MFRSLFLLFLVIPLLEIAVFIQMGEWVGLGWTLAGIVITAVIGVQLLRWQGLSAWREIQLRLAEGQLPALELASAAQLLVAGALLLTPGFVTDSIGFLLLVPAVRMRISRSLSRHWQLKSSFVHSHATAFDENPGADRQGARHRIIEGELVDKDHRD